ncbi:MAG: hypothetical protein AAFU85_04575 [Planctomycetota bacterium]
MRRLLTRNEKVTMQWPPLPDYGCFERWPEDGQSLIHPDDVSTAVDLVPSPRVLRRFHFDGTYYHYSYGRMTFRLRPAMWSRIAHEGLDIGDQIETTGLGMERDHFVATIWGMYYVRRKGCILYRLRRAGRVVPKLFAGNQIRLVHDKSTVRPGNTEYPEPRWDGSGETLSDISIDE